MKYWPVIFILMGLFTIFGSFDFRKQGVYKGTKENMVDEQSDETVHCQDEQHNH